MNDVAQMALDSIRGSKVRSALTILGVMIGVATVIGMSSVISGLNRAITDQIEGLGSNLIFVFRLDPISFGGRTTEELARKKLTLEDAAALRAIPEIRSVAPSIRTYAPGDYAIRYRDRTASGTIIEGIAADHEDVFNLDMRAGRWFNDGDQSHKSNVLILGYDTAETLFPVVENAVGRDVALEGRIFTVVGVLEPRSNGLNPGPNPEDNLVEIPVATFAKLYPGTDDYQMSLQPVSQEAMPTAIDKIEGVLRYRRGVRWDEDNDFAISTQDMFTDLWNQISGGIFAVMLAISSVGLLVGGVGVMNIMLVSVTERTREIGIRKAIGATRRKILRQFLMEAMALTGVGGILGILIGAGLTVLIRLLVPFLPAAMSPFWVAMGFSASVGTGLIFGLYPAWKAARLDPIEALRYE
jgi:putative ABC transport system permease protein